MLEENEPYLETQIKAVAHDSGRRAGSSANRRATCTARVSCSAGRSSKPLERFLPGLRAGAGLPRAG